MCVTGISGGQRLAVVSGGLNWDMSGCCGSPARFNEVGTGTRS